MGGSHFDLSGRRVLVTGGTRGIGAAIADAFEGAGASLILTGTDPAGIEKLNEEATSHGVDREYLAADFADKRSLETFLQAIEDRAPIDVCVNNAGTNRILPLEKISVDDFDWLSAINLRAPLLISRAVAPGMREGGWGRIVNIASIWSVITREGRSLYTATKTGLVGMTRTLSAELAGDGILVNAVSPGFTLTDLTRDSLTDEEMRQLEAEIPIRRLAEPAEIAMAVLFLSSELNTYVTGHNLVIDGGFVTV